MISPLYSRTALAVSGVTRPTIFPRSTTGSEGCCPACDGKLETVQTPEPETLRCVVCWRQFTPQFAAHLRAVRNSRLPFRVR